MRMSRDEILEVLNTKHTNIELQGSIDGEKWWFILSDNPEAIKSSMFLRLILSGEVIGVFKQVNR